MLDVGQKLKELRQRSKQSVSQVCAHLDNLEDQLPTQLPEHQRANNLLFALHPYSRDAFTRKHENYTTRMQVEEAAMLIERTEPNPGSIRTHNILFIIDWLGFEHISVRQRHRRNASCAISFQSLRLAGRGPYSTFTSLLSDNLGLTKEDAELAIAAKLQKEQEMEKRKSNAQFHENVASGAR